VWWGAALVVICYGGYGLVMWKYEGWYSWIISTLVSIVYSLGEQNLFLVLCVCVRARLNVKTGFVRMTPQLFINYRMKSVAHL
jgi:hypothetical protein